MRDELTFNAPANEHTPEPLVKQKSLIMNEQVPLRTLKLDSISNWVSDELTFNASDNEDNPVSPKLLPKNQIKSKQSQDTLIE